MLMPEALKKYVEAAAINFNGPLLTCYCALRYIEEKRLCKRRLTRGR